MGNIFPERRLKNTKFLDGRIENFYDLNFINEETGAPTTNRYYYWDEIEFTEGRKYYCWKEEMRNALLQVWMLDRGRGPTNQFRPTAFSSSLLLRPREGRKFKQMKSWSLLQGGTNLSEENSGQRSIEEESNTIELSGSIRISMELFVPLP